MTSAPTNFLVTCQLSLVTCHSSLFVPPLPRGERGEDRAKILSLQAGRRPGIAAGRVCRRIALPQYPRIRQVRVPGATARRRIAMKPYSPLWPYTPPPATEHEAVERGPEMCVTFHCWDCRAEIRAWVPRLATHPERFGWCDACWQRRKSDDRYDKAA